MKVQSYPLTLFIYKGEGRILINPLIGHGGGYSVKADWALKVRDVENYTKIGKGAIRGLKFIKRRPLSKATPEKLELKAAWKKHSKYENWTAFWENNHLANLELFEDGHYEVQSVKRSEEWQGKYAEYFKEISLPAKTPAAEIGKAIVEVLEALEEYEGSRTLVVDPYPVKQIELINGTMLSVKCPKDSHFSDYGSYHTVEIYQCYKYVAIDYLDRTTMFSVEMSADLNDDLSEANIRKTWERFNGPADFFEMLEVDYGIFKLRVEMRNRNIHVISYLLQLEGDGEEYVVEFASSFLVCTMNVGQQSLRPEIDEQLVNLFDEFVLDCQWQRGM